MHYVFIFTSRVTSSTSILSLSLSPSLSPLKSKLKGGNRKPASLFILNTDIRRDMIPFLVFTGIIIAVVGVNMYQEHQREQVLEAAEFARRGAGHLNSDTNNNNERNRDTNGRHPNAQNASVEPATVNSAEISAGARGVCCVCYDRHSSTLFLPCGHVCACDFCASKLLHQRCPMCNLAYTGKVKVHVS